jgi:uncharacterized membrane protein YbaN (DUF454 family)
MQDRTPEASFWKKKGQAVKKALLFAVGTVSLALGAIGAFIPGLVPTVPFLLLAAACYCRSSERMYKWLIYNRLFGEYLKNYREGKGIPFKSKIIAVTMLWISISISAIFLVPVLIVQVVLLVVAIAVSIHILRLPTYRKKVP